MRQGWHLLGPILPNLLIAVLCLWSLPQVTGLPLSGMARLIPDFGLALISGGLLGIGWSVTRTLWLWAILRYKHRQQHGMNQQVAAVGD